MRKTFAILCSVLALTACTSGNDLVYLVQHQEALRQAVEACQNQTTMTARCQQILTIAERYDEIMNKAMQSPTDLGEFVLTTQAACVTAEQAMKTAKNNLTALQAKSAALAEIATAEKNFAARQQAYEDKRMEVEILYAVIGSNSPE